MTTKWKSGDLKRAASMIASASTLTEGYALAARELETTPNAIRLLRERGALGDVAPKGKPPKHVEELAPADEHRLKVALTSERARAKSILKDLVSTQAALDALTTATSTPLPPIKRRELRSGLREATAIAMLSDVHADETVRAGETPYPNEYNPEIAHRSIERFFSGLEWLVNFNRNAFVIRDVVCWLGGDLMSGHIHDELKEHTSGTPLEMMLWLRPRLVAGIDRLLADPKIERIFVPCSYGNHGRNTPRPYRALGAVHSYEWVLYQFLALHYASEPRVYFLADKSAHQYVEVFGKTLHFHHGDETNYQGGVGGITIPLNKASAQWDLARKSDYHHFGHWHQYQDTGRIVVNGSVIGFNAYAMSIKATPEPPQQAFYLLDSKRGKTCKSPIWVRE